jgi:hypothetical protein
MLKSTHAYGPHAGNNAGIQLSHAAEFRVFTHIPERLLVCWFVCYSGSSCIVFRLYHQRLVINETVTYDLNRYTYKGWEMRSRYVTRYCWGDYIKQNEMGGAYSTYGGAEKDVQGFVWEAWSENVYWRTTRMLEDNTKINLQRKYISTIDTDSRYRQ